MPMSTRSTIHDNVSRTSGFTLVELVVVVLVLGIVAGVAAPRLMDTSDAAKESAAATLVEQVRDQIDMYFAEHGEYPATLEAGWFRGQLVNPYDPDHPTPLWIANSGNRYPTHKTLRSGSCMWYDRANGAFAVRVSPQESDAATIALFNRVNGFAISTLDQKN